MADARGTRSSGPKTWEPLGLARQLNLDTKGNTAHVASGIYDHFARHHRNGAVASWWVGCPGAKKEDETWLAEMQELLSYIGLAVTQRGKTRKLTAGEPYLLQDKPCKFPRTYLNLFMELLSGKAAEAESAASQRARGEDAAADGGGEDVEAAAIDCSPNLHLGGIPASYHASPLTTPARTRRISSRPPSGPVLSTLFPAQRPRSRT